MTRRPAPPTALLDLLAGPPLPGARCRGQAPAFDGDLLDDETPTEQAERHQAAAARCQTCPALVLCREAFDALPERLQRGVWAGQIVVEGQGRGRRSAA